MLRRFRLFRVVLLLCGVSVVFGAALVRAQDAPSQDLINAILKQMRSQLGRAISAFDTFTYQTASFADSSLDCPAQGKTYTPGPYPGYKFLITVEGVIYDVRSTLDGTQVVLCANDKLRQNVALATYRSPAYGIPYPTNWKVTERQVDTFFGLSTRPLCAQPGMIVTPLGPAGNKSPDALLDDYTASQRGVGVAFENVRLAVRKIGSSGVYIAPCTDGTPRKHRVTAFVAYGQAYRVLQFTPEMAFTQWDDTFRKILDEFAPAATGASEGGQPILPPAESPRAAIAHIFGGNVYVGALVDLPGTPITSGARADRAYSDIAFSPKGDQVVFLDPYQGTLYLASVGGGEGPRVLATNVSAVYPAAWSPNGDEIAYLAPKSAAEKSLTVYAASLASGVNREIGQTQAFAGPCRGALPIDPAERLYATQVGERGFPKNAVYWTRAGTIYYTIVCGTGIGAIPASGGPGEVMSPDLYRPRLSPDGSTFVGLLTEDGQLKTPATLVQMRTSDKQTSPLVIAPDGAFIDLTAWSGDGKALYYAVLAPKQTLKLASTADEERGKKFFGSWPVETQVNTLALHRIELTTGVDSEVFTGEGRGIGQIAPAPDGSGLLLALIQDSSALYEAFTNNLTTGELLRLMPQSRLYWLPTGADSTNAQLIAISVAPSWGPVGSALAPTPTGGVGTYLPGRFPSSTPTPKPTLTPKFTLTPTPQATTQGVPPPTNTPRVTPIGTATVKSVG